MCLSESLLSEFALCQVCSEFCEAIGTQLGREPLTMPIWETPPKVAFRFHEPEALVLKLRALAFLRARAQSAEPDGARDRNRTGFSEHDRRAGARARMSWEIHRLGLREAQNAQLQN